MKFTFLSIQYVSQIAINGKLTSYFCCREKKKRNIYRESRLNHIYFLENVIKNN